jgi:hypothetical protein
MGHVKEASIVKDEDVSWNFLNKRASNLLLAQMSFGKQQELFSKHVDGY